MTLWIPLTLCAAFLQNLRSATQKYLRSVMGTTGATFVRFGFGVPFAALYLGLMLWAHDAALPKAGPDFAFWVLLGAFAQIFGTYFLVYLFGFRNFAVGTAYSRTAPAQAVLFGLLFLGERSGWGALLAIMISVAGVIMISLAHVRAGPRAMLAGLVQRHALIGLGSGALFGASSVAYRAASLSLDSGPAELRASMTLLSTLCVQTLVMALWMFWRDKAEIARIAKGWKVATLAGFAGSTASFMWITAMTLQQAALVKALGLVEMVFTVLATVFIFKEKITSREAVGCALIVGGIVLLLAF